MIMDNVEQSMRIHIEHIGPEELKNEMQSLVMQFFEKYPHLHPNMVDPVFEFHQIYLWVLSEVNLSKSNEE